MSEESELATSDRLLGQVCRLHHSLARALLNGIGLYRGQPQLLDILHEQEGLTHTELAARLRVVPATMTKMLQRMERTGFVVRQPDEKDQRVSRVYLTDAGREVRDDMRLVLQQLAEETFADFTMEERVLMRRLLLQIRDNLSVARD
jgi:DNA-binding MarR family transcriptional regulator